VKRTGTSLVGGEHRTELIQLHYI